MSTCSLHDLVLESLLSIPFQYYDYLFLSRDSDLYIYDLFPFKGVSSWNDEVKRGLEDLTSSPSGWDNLLS